VRPFEGEKFGQPVDLGGLIWMVIPCNNFGVVPLPSSQQLKVTGITYKTFLVIVMMLVVIQYREGGNSPTDIFSTGYKFMKFPLPGFHQNSCRN